VQPTPSWLLPFGGPTHDCPDDPVQPPVVEFVDRNPCFSQLMPIWSSRPSFNR
jgi:hypothetical protein